MRSTLTNDIMHKPAGAVFSALDFLDLARRNTIDQALSRLARQRRIKKVGTGLYCILVKNPVVGDIPPHIDKIVQAYAQKFGYKIQVSPAKAANLLGLSLQVPAQQIYLTDGPPHALILGGGQVIFKHVSPRKLLGIGTKAGLMIQALYYYGRKGIDPALASKIKDLLDDKDRKHLRRWLDLMPLWMQTILVRDILNA